MPKAIQDEFSHLPRAKRYQLRNLKKGLCMFCKNPLYVGQICKKHSEQHKAISAKHYIASAELL